MLPDGEGNPVEGEGGVDGTADGQPVEEEGEGGVVTPTTRRLTIILLVGGGRLNTAKGQCCGSESGAFLTPGSGIRDG
jgi:hypothetical protein